MADHSAAVQSQSHKIVRQSSWVVSHQAGNFFVCESSSFDLLRRPVLFSALPRPTAR